MSVTTIGLDLAKSIFQIHGVDARGDAVPKRRVRRGELMALGHEVRLVAALLQKSAPEQAGPFPVDLMPRV